MSMFIEAFIEAFNLKDSLYILSNLIPEDWNNCEMGFFAGIFPVQLQSPPNPYPLPLGLHVPTTKNGFQKDWLSRIEPIVL